MPKFLIISPTHVSGKKRYAWKQFKENNYIALGWMDVDLTNKSMDEVKDVIYKSNEVPENKKSDAIKHFKKFLSLKKGDYVGVKNTIDGLFGIGKIISNYKYRHKIHRPGPDEEDCYSHTFSVDWIVTTYLKRTNIIREDEKSWVPFGTFGTLHKSLPPYVLRILGKNDEKDDEKDKAENKKEIKLPQKLVPILSSLKELKNDSNHKERSHESIVEDFLVKLGYKKHKHIKFRQGRIDISIKEDNQCYLIIEVKRKWNLNLNTAEKAVQQAYGYALKTGTQLVVITNGDDYLLFDRLKGLSIKDNYLGKFKISSLTKDGLDLLNQLKPDKILD